MRSGRSPIFVFGLSSSFPAWHVWQNSGLWQEEHRFCPWRAYVPWELMKTPECRKFAYGFIAPVETSLWHSRQSTRPVGRSSGCFGGTDGVCEAEEQPNSRASSAAPRIFTA